MYILYKTESRAETTDTIIFYVCKEREPLEEIILSLFDELYELMAYNGGYTNLNDVYRYCKTVMDNYNIIYAPEI